MVHWFCIRNSWKVLNFFNWWMAIFFNWTGQLLFLIKNCLLSRAYAEQTLWQGSNEWPKRMTRILLEKLEKRCFGISFINFDSWTVQYNVSFFNDTLVLIEWHNRTNWKETTTVKLKSFSVVCLRWVRAFATALKKLHRFYICVRVNMLSPNGLKSQRLFCEDPNPSTKFSKNWCLKQHKLKMAPNETVSSYWIDSNSFDTEFCCSIKLNWNEIWITDMN